MREANPGADFLIHPECGCSTSVMEYVAAGDVDAENTHMLSTGGMLKHARESDADTFIVATETGMLHPLELENPDKTFVPANRAAVCQYMKMITLPKLRDALRDLKPVVKVDPEIAERARVPIERMVAITPVGRRWPWRARPRPHRPRGLGPRAQPRLLPGAAAAAGLDHASARSRESEANAWSTSAARPRAARGGEPARRPVGCQPAAV